MVTAQKLMGNLAVQVFITVQLHTLQGKRVTIMYDVRPLLQVVIPWTVGKPLITQS
jgi:hypothetical protein